MRRSRFWRLTAMLMVISPAASSCKRFDADGEGGQREPRSGLSLFGLRAESMPRRCDCRALVDLESRSQYPRVRREGAELACVYTASGGSDVTGELTVRVARVGSEFAFDQEIGAALSQRVRMLDSSRFAVAGGEAFVAVVAGSAGVERIGVVSLPALGMVATASEPLVTRADADLVAGYPAYAHAVAANAAQACR